MFIFKQNNKTLEPIHELKIDLEKDIQTLTEQNLEIIFGLQFVTTEFQLNNLRIDTLAFDEETNSFVIIEYKRDRSFSVIDQGFAYLSLLLNQKADFILKYININGNTIDQSKIDWSQSKVIFVANSYTKYQEQAINFQDLPIELWEVKRFSNSTIIFNQLQAPQSSESIKKISTNKAIEKVSKEIKKYTPDDLFKQDWEHSKNLYEKFMENVQEKYSADISATKLIIKIIVDRKRLFEIVVHKSSLLLAFPMKINELKDPDHTLRDVSKMGRWTTGFTEFKLGDEKDIDYAMYLIKQVYEKMK